MKNKPVVFMFFLLVASNAFSQSNMPFSKVIFNYSIGGNSWCNPGIYSKSETFEITLVRDSTYSITRYLAILGDAGADGGTFTKDTTDMYTDDRVTISKRNIDSLYKQLNTTKDNFSFSFIRPKLKEPTKRQIIKIAKKLQEYFKIQDADSVQQLIEKMQHFDKLDAFIKINKPDPAIYKAVIDAWDFTSIIFINNTDTIKYSGGFIDQVLGQPYQRLKTNDQIVNLEINTLINSMLPKLSLLKKRIAINSITEDYLKWYIKNL